ncbi:prepilin-type N-terminal cleavage/methylation domain-containing protein [bacterium]|nr:prepilin-type N-terminal cleavage/methylation domain-containing protein [bacterium]
MQKQKAGFTLIELLIVVAIIAILAAIAVPNFLEAQTRSKVSRVHADQRTIVTAIESYSIDWNRYPPASRPFGNTRVRNRVIDRYIMMTTPVAYITTIPKDVFWNGREQNIPLTWGADVFDYFERQSTPLVTNPWGPDSELQSALWFLSSWGPDGEIDSDNNATGPSGDGPYYMHIQYDPTNGSISDGDISRWGP